MRVAAAAAIAMLLSVSARADWPHWRGPHFNGTGDGTGDGTGLPVSWSPTENVAWKTELPGPSAATPVVANGRVFVTAMNAETLAISAMCLDRATGRVLWTHEAGEGRRGPRDGFENSRAECSPVTDGETVCFMFGNGRLMAFDEPGRRLWERDIVEEFGEIQNWWGYASSPLLLDGTVYVQVLRSGESFLLAVDAKTGTTKWRHVRADTAREESEQAYTSPIPFDNGGRTEILVLGADCVTAHDPESGAERWRWSDLNPRNRGNYRAIANPVTAPGFVYVVSPQGNPLHAIKVDGTTATEAWSLKRPTPDVVTPLYYDGRLYVIDGKGRRNMVCLDPTTGERFWEQELDAHTYIRSSPTAADGKIYVMDTEGFVNVIAAGDEYALLGQADMGSEPSRASIAIDGSQLLIRTADALYCVGANSKTNPTTAPKTDPAPGPTTRPIGAAPAGAPAAPGAAHWPGFRGPNAGGVSDGHALAVEWNVDDGTNVAWKTPIPGLAHSSPAIWGDMLFVTTAVNDREAPLKVGLYGQVAPVADEGEHAFKVYCLDRTTGAVRWERTAHTGVPAVKRHTKGSHAASSPATDGRHVLAFFGSEGLYCYDVAGNLLWSRDFGVLDSGWYTSPDMQWGFASSPIIHGDKVIVQCDVQEGSFLAALELSDGTDLWRTPRDDVPTWSTPTVDVRDGRRQVIVNGYRHIGGYDLDTGAELWKLVGGGDIPVPTPIVAHDLVFITNAHGRMAPIYAINPLATGTITAEAKDTIPWMTRRQGNYMQTPLVYGDLLYCCKDAGVLAVYDARTGELHYRERIGSGQSGFTASTVAGDGKLYLTSESGEVHVVRTGPTFERLAVSELGETCLATPAIAAGTLYFRTRHHVVAITPSAGQ